MNCIVFDLDEVPKTPNERRIQEPVFSEEMIRIDLRRHGVVAIVKIFYSKIGLERLCQTEHSPEILGHSVSGSPLLGQWRRQQGMNFEGLEEGNTLRHHVRSQIKDGRLSTLWLFQLCSVPRSRVLIELRCRRFLAHCRHVIVSEKRPVEMMMTLVPP